MYYAHFGLRELPFNLTPDTSFFFACSNYQEALNTLLVAARTGEGFIKITGEVGSGKTLLCRKFMASLGEPFVTAYVPNPYLSPRGLLTALAEDLRVPMERDSEVHHLLKGITRGLLEHARHGKRVVVCMDEAQAMPLETLEALRLLTNLETQKRKLIQVVLFGQPELDVNLKQDSVRQLRQRITFQYRLGGLRRDEVDHYLSHRLRVAGYQGDRLFEKRAVGLVRDYSGGTPRLVNILAHKSMLLAFGEGANGITPKHVRTAALDTPAARRWYRPLQWFGMTAAAAVVTLTRWGMLP
jgi:MSHA biogenesis protein MshM